MLTVLLSKLLDNQSGIKPKVLDKAIVLNVAPMLRLNEP